MEHLALHMCGIVLSYDRFETGQFLRYELGSSFSSSLCAIGVDLMEHYHLMGVVRVLELSTNFGYSLVYFPELTVIELEDGIVGIIVEQIQGTGQLATPIALIVLLLSWNTVLLSFLHLQWQSASGIAEITQCQHPQAILVALSSELVITTTAILCTTTLKRGIALFSACKKLTKWQSKIP